MTFVGPCVNSTKSETNDSLVQQVFPQAVQRGIVIGGIPQTEALPPYFVPRTTSHDLFRVPLPPSSCIDTPFSFNNAVGGCTGDEGGSGSGVRSCVITSYSVLPDDTRYRSPTDTYPLSPGCGNHSHARHDGAVFFFNPF